jgi:hypothetical protein
MSAPIRVQRQRAKGWKMPPNTVSVTRPGKWGNPFVVGNCSSVIDPVTRFACEVAPLLDLTPLRGKNLACWCKLGEPCHADILLELANAEPASQVTE